MSATPYKVANNHKDANRTMAPSPSNDIKQGDDALGLETTSQTTDSIVRAPDGIDEKKLMRKIDLRVVPWLSVLYLLSFLDRSAIGNAKLYGMANELKTSDQQFNLATA